MSLIVGEVLRSLRLYRRLASLESLL